MEKLPPDVERQIEAAAQQAHEDIDEGIMWWAVQRDSQARRHFVIVEPARCFHGDCEYRTRPLTSWPSACRCEVWRPDRNVRIWASDCAAHGVTSDWKYAAEVAAHERRRKEPIEWRDQS